MNRSFKPDKGINTRTDSHFRKTMPGSDTSSVVSAASLALSFQSTYYGDPNQFGSLTPELSLRTYLRAGVLFSFPRHMRTAANGGDVEAVLILADLYVREAIGDLSSLTVDPPNLIHDLCCPGNSTVTFRGLVYHKLITAPDGGAAPTLLFHSALEVAMRVALSPSAAPDVLADLVARTGVQHNWLLPFSMMGATLAAPTPALAEALFSMLSNTYLSRPRSLPRTRGCTRRLLVYISKVGFEIYSEHWAALAPESLIQRIEEEA